ncbi:hypothetical protein ACPCAE_29770 [Streptomyces cinereoruber]|uniref:hypothetical protein n=1 Tax=Streptomyces cinereoruber TaxID=67260 RepID=UPI003C2D56AD
MNAVSGPVAERDRLDDYAEEVADHLLALPHRERAETVAGLAAHLREGGSGADLPSPAAYARHLAEETGAHHRPLTFMGLASRSWPTPGEWVASGLRGVAALYLLAILWSVALAVGSDVIAAGGPLLPALDHGVGEVMRVPQIGGSERLGAAVLLPLAWVAGQLATGLLLERDPAWRRRLRTATRGAVAVLALVALYIVTDLFR